MRNRIAILQAVSIALLLSYGSVIRLAAQSAKPAPPIAKPAEVSKDDKAAIKAVLEEQTAAWNRGDIPGFMASYEDSPDTTFVGATTVNKGFSSVLERYKNGYANRDQMGKLTFKDLDIRLLPASTGSPEYAVVTGHFHLDRSVKGTASKDDGIFSLVFRKGPSGWKIVLDHTS